MRSLFVRIFLSFWLAMILIFAGFAVLSIVREPGWWLERARFLTSQALYLHGMSLEELREAGREDEARAADLAFRERTGLRAYLVAPDVLEGAPSELPPDVLAVAREAAAGGEGLWRDSSDVDYYAQPLHETGLARAVVVGEIRHRPSWARILGPAPIELRLLIVFAVSGLVCFGLARLLSRPLGQLRHATRALAEEQLGVRVTPQLGGRRDEIGALGRDFDAMADRIEALLDDQRRLLRDVSHELRSPLARLSVALELARQSEGDEAQAQLARIELEAGRLNELIGQMLNVAQLEAQSAGVAREPVALTELVRRVVADADFEGQSTHRGVALVEADEVTVRGLEETLRRAVENVVRNAIRFTAEGTAIEVSVTRGEGPDGPIAHVRVRDHGPGVPEEDLERIFQPFVRVGEARDRRSGGTGIGLAVTHRAVRLHGGAVEARNAEGGGLVVEMRIPATAA